jgi:hypothetical protein
MTRPLPDAQDAAAFRMGFDAALGAVERMARRDCRVALAKSCGYVPGWQKGRWMVADAVAELIRQRALSSEERQK